MSLPQESHKRIDRSGSWTNRFHSRMIFLPASSPSTTVGVFEGTRCSLQKWRIRGPPNVQASQATQAPHRIASSASSAPALAILCFQPRARPARASTAAAPSESAAVLPQRGGGRPTERARCHAPHAGEDEWGPRRSERRRRRGGRVIELYMGCWNPEVGW